MEYVFGYQSLGASCYVWPVPLLCPKGLVGAHQGKTQKAWQPPRIMVDGTKSTRWQQVEAS